MLAVDGGEESSVRREVRLLSNHGRAAMARASLSVSGRAEGKRGDRAREPMGAQSRGNNLYYTVA
jgi:hypothetical protein